MVVGKNLDYIRKLVSNPSSRTYKDILDCLLEGDFTHRPRGEIASQKSKAANLAMVQLCLAPMILGRGTSMTPVHHFDASQRVVYSNSRAPLFKGKYKSQVNIDVLLNTLNFFKFHLKAGNGEGLLNDAYSRLDADQLPQMWAGKIPVGTQPLSGHWKGISSRLAFDDYAFRY